MNIICSQIEGKKGIMAYTKQYFTEQPEDVKLNTLLKVIMGCIAIIMISCFSALCLYLLPIEKIYNNWLKEIYNTWVKKKILKDYDVQLNQTITTPSCNKKLINKVDITDSKSERQTYNNNGDGNFQISDTSYDRRNKWLEFNSDDKNVLTITSSKQWKEINEIKIYIKLSTYQNILWIVVVVLLVTMPIIITINVGLIQYIFKNIIYINKDSFIFKAFIKSLFKDLISLTVGFVILIALVIVNNNTTKLFKSIAGIALLFVFITFIILYSLLQLKYTYRWMLLFFLLFCIFSAINIFIIVANINDFLKHKKPCQIALHIRHQTHELKHDNIEKCVIVL